jgi:death on curing protein
MRTDDGAREDDRFRFVIDVATGATGELDQIADHLCAWSYREG